MRHLGQLEREPMYPSYPAILVDAIVTGIQDGHFSNILGLKKNSTSQSFSVVTWHSGSIFKDRKGLIRLLGGSSQLVSG